MKVIENESHNSYSRLMCVVRALLWQLSFITKKITGGSNIFSNIEIYLKYYLYLN